MRKFILILVVLAIGFSASSNVIAVETLGIIGCGTWIKNRATPNQPTWSAVVDEFWLYGYLSGLAVGSNVDILKVHPDKDSLNLWMDNYCKKNPLNIVQEGANDLFVDLNKRMHK
jgi:hypothetical protein